MNPNRAFSIEPATAQDQEGVIRAIKAVYDEYGFAWEPEGYHYDLYHLEEHYADDCFLVAKAGGVVVATAALKFFPTIPGDTQTTVLDGFVRVVGADCSMERLYVPAENRRRGLGMALVQELVSEARRRKCLRMEIWSDKRFVEAHQLYQKLGARTVGERICHDPEQSPEWGLALDL